MDFRGLVALGAVGLFASCGATNRTVDVEHQPPSPAPARIAAEPPGRPDGGSVAGPLPFDGPYEGPAHRFSPRRHEPIERYGRQVKPKSPSLPQLKVRTGRCFGSSNEKQIAAQAPAVIARPKKARKSPSFSKGEMSSGKGRELSESAASAPPRADVLGAVSVEESEAPEAPHDLRSESPASGGDAAEALKSESDDEAREDRDRPATEIATGPQAGPQGPVMQYNDWGRAVYLSNDDTMSLSSAQRVIYAIDNFLPLPASHIRPHELLNYFSFETAEVEAGYDFSVRADLAEDERNPGIHTLALAVAGRSLDKSTRRNTALTMVLDRSGSMRDEGRMEYLKRGLRRMLEELKDKDVVNLVLFDQEVCVPVEGFVVGRDDPKVLQKVIDRLAPRGATDLHLGLTRGYELADRHYVESYSNRVVMVTDALTNTGITNSSMISMVSKYYDSRRIRLSGIGVGRQFNDALLDELTERGKGAYVFLGSDAEVDAVFGGNFISLIETTALDVHFRLHLPPSLRMNVFYGEESSANKADVQEIHYFANTSQLFLADLMARGGVLREQDEIMLGIEYRDPLSGEALLEERAFRLSDIRGGAYNVRKSRLIMAWIDMLAMMASRPVPGGFRHGAGTWVDAQGWEHCERGRKDLASLSAGIEGDPEVGRVLGLWDKYCARYDRPRNPEKRAIPAAPSSWPGASGEGRR